MTERNITSALLGVAAGDAVGVPYEFNTRERMKAHPARAMVGFGSHNQPAGTWSDDSSLTFCLAESLLNGYDLKDIAQKFVLWKHEAYWSSRGTVFDIGITTSKAISRLAYLVQENDLKGLEDQKFYGDEQENGNGSLMRIIPLLCTIQGKSNQEQFDIIWEVSALTHRHIRAAMSCFIYLKLAEKLLNGQDKIDAYQDTRMEVQNFWEEIDFDHTERTHFRRVVQENVCQLHEDELRSGGYVIEVLESAFWYFLKKDNFEATVLGIINLGHDTDTSAAIAGGLAGLYYGTDGISDFWLASLARMEDIFALGRRLDQKYFDIKPSK